MNLKKISVFLCMLFTMLLLVSCQEKVRQISLQNLKTEEGYYQYEDFVWGSSQAELEEVLGKALQKEAEVQGTILYGAEVSFEYEGVPAQASYEFYKDKLYQVSFSFQADDAKDKDLGVFCADMLENLKENYGEATREETGIVNEIHGVSTESDYYIWELITEEHMTTVQLRLTKTNGEVKHLDLGVVDAALSQKYAQ